MVAKLDTDLSFTLLPDMETGQEYNITVNHKILPTEPSGGIGIYSWSDDPESVVGMAGSPARDATDSHPC